VEGLLECAGRWGRRLGKDRRLHAPGPELIGGQIPPIEELGVAEADGERHDGDVVTLGQVRRQIAGAVGDDLDPAHGSLAPGLEAVHRPLYDFAHPPVVTWDTDGSGPFPPQTEL